MHLNCLLKLVAWRGIELLLRLAGGVIQVHALHRLTMVVVMLLLLLIIGDDLTIFLLIVVVAADESICCFHHNAVEMVMV